jgi:hypothetical protein
VASNVSFAMVMTFKVDEFSIAIASSTLSSKGENASGFVRLR